MEEEFVKYLICHLLEERFQSREEMAEEVGISHLDLLEAGAGQCAKKTAVRVTSQILRYCIRQKIPLDTFSCPVALSDPT